MNVLNRLKSHRMPEQSVFYNQLLPVLLLLLAVITISLVVFALGVLTGLVAWS